ncbi:divergent polysaccharide deacetylase family protein [Pseudooceanicola sp.]|uniref:divergent polysaccharide deacetylase family protein n=1 Tax=Pseudooceanicola sp. TaxID=1914328 RepID=UPI0026157B19|nr:divergent polysaccharide deacetylase family protein [Pseudooceanicola sp.]MDF1855441.1 divergent polysaccharide deacetylase family protein [Pseudooceanicola sp.]
MAVISLNGSLPGDAPPRTGAAEVPGGSEFNQSRADVPVTLPGQEAVSKPPEADSPPPPGRDGLDAIDSAAKEPGNRPETGEPESRLAAVPPAGDAPLPGSNGSETPPVQPTPVDNAPDAPSAPVAEVEPRAVPQSTGQTAVPANVTQPQSPDAGAEGSGVGFPSQDLQAAAEAPLLRSPTGSAPPVAAKAEIAPPADTGSAVAPVAPTQPQQPEVSSTTDPAPMAPAADTAAPQVAATDPATAPAESGTVPQADTTPPAVVARAESVMPPNPGATSGPAVGRPATRLTETGGGMRSARLPSIGNATGDSTTAAQTSAADDPSLPPIRRYAVAFDNPENRPLMSIVLLDDGSGAVDASVLRDFPYPLTIAVDPSWSGAAQAMADYRAAGFEVMLLAGVAPEATAKDLETAFEVWTNVLPEVTAVMEKPGLGLQASRPAADQLADLLMASGHGLVLYPNGFDTARKLAVKTGVPAATLFRDFDGDGQSANVIRRFLDHAAFRAGTEGGVVMVGRVRPETVQALLVWGLQDRAGRVAIAPISALLLAGVGAGSG